MKKICLSLIVLTLFLTWACSYDDGSSGPDNPVPEIVIDTTGIPEQLLINYGEQLQVKPGVYCESNPEMDFSYEWRLSLYSNTSKTLMDPVYKIAGTEQHLDYTVDLPPDASTYQLWYHVKDNKSKQVKTIMWAVLVDASSGQGLMVAHSKDGITSDLSVIQDTLFTAEFKRAANGPHDPTLIKHDLYSAANGKPYNGIIRELTFQQRHYDKRMTNFVDGHSIDNCFRVNLIDFTLNLEGEEMFLYRNPVIDIRRMFVGSYTGAPSYSSTRVIWNNRGFQRMAPTSATMDVSEKRGYGIPSPGSWAAATTPGAIVQYDPDPVLSWGTTYFMFYDRLEGRFLFMRNSFSDGETVSQCADTGTAFDPRNLPGLELIHAGAGDNLDHRFIVRHEGRLKILSLVQTTGAARAMIDINDAPEISDATHFVICNNQPVVYYSTSGGKVYSILFIDGLGNDVRYQHVYTSAEPINGMYLSRGNSKVIEYDFTSILMTTTTGQNEGKVWVLPMENLGTGNINTSKIVSFTGFGRISTVAMID